MMNVECIRTLLDLIPKKWAISYLRKMDTLEGEQHYEQETTHIRTDHHKTPRSRRFTDGGKRPEQNASYGTMAM